VSRQALPCFYTLSIVIDRSIPDKFFKGAEAPYVKYENAVLKAAAKYLPYEPHDYQLVYTRYGWVWSTCNHAYRFREDRLSIMLMLVFARFLPDTTLALGKEFPKDPAMIIGLSNQSTGGRHGMVHFDGFV